MKIYNLTSYIKTCDHISFKMLSSDLSSDCRDLMHLRWIDSKVEKTIDEIFFHRLRAWFVEYRIDNQRWRNLCSTVDEISVCCQWNFFCINEIWPHKPNLSRFTCECIICSLDNTFSSQQTHIISRVESVMYHWLDRIWIQSSI